MASSLLALLTQHTPQLQTRKALIVVGLQNDFLSPEGKLPVDLVPGFLDKVKSLVPAFREHGEVIWVRSIASSAQDAKGHADDSANTITTGSYVASDETRSIKNGAKRGAVDDNTAAAKRMKADDSELDPELFLSNTATREACCLRNTWGAEHPDDIKSLMEKKDLQLVKRSYSAFASTSLLTTLRMRLITELYICGCMTNLSVYATAMDAATHGIQITLVEDALGFRQRTRHDEAVKQLKHNISAKVVSESRLVDRLCNAVTSEEEASVLSNDDDDDEEAVELTTVPQTAKNGSLSVISASEADDSLAADSEDDEGEIELPQVGLPRTRSALPLRCSSLLARNRSRSPATALQPTSQHSQFADPRTAALAHSDALVADSDVSELAHGRERSGMPVVHADYLEPDLQRTDDDSVKEERMMSRKLDQPPENLPRTRDGEEKVLETCTTRDGGNAHSGSELQPPDLEPGHAEVVSTSQQQVPNEVAEDIRATEEKQSGTDDDCDFQRIESHYQVIKPSELAQEVALGQPMEAEGHGHEAVEEVIGHPSPIVSLGLPSDHEAQPSDAANRSSNPLDIITTVANEVPGSPVPDTILVEAVQHLQISVEHESKPLLGEGKEVESAGSQMCYGLLPPEFSDTIFDLLHREVEWQTMQHQTGQVPRLVCCQGTVAEDGSVPVYRHPSDQTMSIQPWSATVKVVQKAAEELVGHPLNHALIQLYRGGTDYISEHSDKTLDIAKGSFIVNVSLGAQRTMRLRTKRLIQDSTNEDATPVQRTTHRVIMPHNSCITMSLATNAEYLHGINADKRRSVELSDAEKAYDGQRISLTFRHIATFLSADEQKIWGQGATAKTKDEARNVINADAVESDRLVKAFGAENQASSIDWDAVYGEGSDVLHLR